MPPGAFTFSLFVSEWNAFISIAALDAVLTWHTAQGVSTPGVAADSLQSLWNFIR